MSNDQKQPIFIRLFRDGKLVETKQFTQTQIVMGREGEVDLIIPDTGASPIHAMVEEREPDHYYLCDLGSQGGTLFNGRKVVDERIQSGDEFQIGGLKVEFHIGVPKPKRPAPSQVHQTAPAEPPPVADLKPELGFDRPLEMAKPEKPKSEAPKTEAPKPRTVPPKPQAPPRASQPATTASASGGAGMQTVIPSKPVQRAKHGTYAPKSTIDISATVKPGTGPVVEVLLIWKDRLIQTYQFRDRGTISFGSHPKNQIILPVIGSVRVSHPFITIASGATVNVTSDMGTEVVRKNGAPSRINGGSHALQQDELIRVDLGEGVKLVVRYAQQPPSARMLPLLDFTANQLSALVVGLLGMVLFLFWVVLYAPEVQEQIEQEQQPPRKAQFYYKKEVEELKPEAPAVTGNVQEAIKDKELAPSRGEEGKASEAKPNNSNSTKKILTADKPGKDKGIQKKQAKNDKPDGGAKSAAKDVNKTGMLSVFGTKGVQDQLNKAYQGSGNVEGLSKSATGAGAEAAGAGNVPGNGLRETGAGGNGTATVGIAGVNTKGKGGGVQGYGTGSLGAKKNASVIPGGDDAQFTGTIDREAIRRVVRANIGQIRACYEKALNQDPSLYGKIVIQWTIGPQGQVVEAGVKSTTMNSPAVESCAVARLKTWKFPVPPTNELPVVSYPFVFQAQE